jgi:Tol biopolymer transport system component
LGSNGTFLSTDGSERKDICITSLDGKCTRPLIHIDEEWTTFFQEPATSPDDRFIAAVTETFDDSRIKLFDARTGRHIRDLTHGHSDLFPTWSPAGRHVAFLRGVPQSGRGPSAAICYVEIGGGKVRCPVPKVTDDATDSPPSWGG